MLSKLPAKMERKRKREQNKLTYEYLEKVYFEGMTSIEKQALHCSAYQVGFKPVQHDRASYIIRSDVVAPKYLTCDRLRSEPVSLKDGQQEMSLKRFCSKYLLDPNKRNAKDGYDVDENIEVDTLRYKYMLVGQYPALGEWHFLVKRYKL